MWLIQCHSLQLQEFAGLDIPSYAILSHTWGKGEVTFDDFLQGATARTERLSQGWRKITEACKLAITHGYDYVWVDTCCINKTSSAELAEAINSMYAWYANSGRCFVYLSDFDPLVGTPLSRNARFLASRWFSRGWTLQELIAPPDVQFYDSGWNWYGSKASLAADIAYATGIDESVLFRIGPDLQSSLAAIPVCRKMSWASNRQTERKEDIAYCLMGIFGVNMSLIYGEGTNAFIRLQKEIIESTNDLTILAWKSQGQQHLPWDNFGILAQSPREFSDSKDIILSQDLKYNPDFSVTNKGLRITVALPVTCGIEKPIMSLYCHRQDRPHESLGIYLGILGGEVYSRALPHVIPIEVEGKRSREASIFLSMDLERRNVTNSALVRGHHFSFRYTYPPEMIGAVRLLSSHPAKRWDESFGFRAKDTPTFVGITTYKAFWQGKASNFVIVCGFGPDAPPWASMDIEGSELWYAAEQRDFLRAGGLGRTQQTEHISLRTEMELNVEIRPFLADDGEPRWMQIEVRVDQRRKHPRTHHKTRPRRLVDYRDRALLLPEPDVT